MLSLNDDIIGYNVNPVNPLEKSARNLQNKVNI